MLAPEEAVVAGENHQRVLVEALRIQRVEHAADVGVDVAHHLHLADLVGVAPRVVEHQSIEARPAEHRLLFVDVESAIGRRSVRRPIECLAGIPATRCRVLGAHRGVHRLERQRQGEGLGPRSAGPIVLEEVEGIVGEDGGGVAGAAHRADGSGVFFDPELWVVVNALPLECSPVVEAGAGLEVGVHVPLADEPGAVAGGPQRILVDRKPVVRHRVEPVVAVIPMSRGVLSGHQRGPRR